MSDDVKAKEVINGGEWEKRSAVAHIMLPLFACLAGLFVYLKSSPEGFGLYKCIAISFGVSYGYAVVAFLLFAIPLKRGSLKKSSLRYRWLNRFSGEECGTRINICHLPGMLMMATLVSLFTASVILVIADVFIFGNIICPLLAGRYMTRDLEIKKISWMPNKMWIFTTIALGLYFSRQIIDYGKSVISMVIPTLMRVDFNLVVPFATSFLVLIMIILFLLRPNIWSLIWDLFKTINGKICITGKVLDE